VRLALVALAVLSTVSCRQTSFVGSLACQLGDCAPPESVCGVDGRCVPGCTLDSEACVAGSTCDATTGLCTGGSLTTPCSDDSACDPPGLVCSLATHTCAAGCTVSNECAPGFVCDFATGHCCDPSQPGCEQPPDLGSLCNTDSECVGAPANICSGGACVPGCAATGCTAPLACNSATGHCQQPTCALDTDCDPGSWCTQAGTCQVLAFAGAIPCAGGTPVSYKCAQKTSPADFSACAGAPGPGGCPYCIDSSCFHPGLCSTVNDCHRGDACSNGVCVVEAPPCPASAIVALADIVAGKYAAGKELCVRGTVLAERTGFDGMIEIKLDSSPYLFVDEAPYYQPSGVRLPGLNEVVTVHGTVRWDSGHNDRELLPVDWVSP
jgi:hypothetical protein